MPAPLDVVGVEPPSLVAFAYLSTPTVPFSDRDLSDLLLAARLWNARHDVTGKLVALEDGDRIVRFAQWIEGPGPEMAVCMGRVLADDRHGDLEVRHKGPVAARRYPGWDMAILPVGDAAFAAEAAGVTSADA